MSDEPATRRSPWWAWIVIALALPVVLIAAVAWLIWAVGVLILVWATWCPRGRFALVVYSNSPVWQSYFEEHVLPAVRGRAVVLNWSERQQWSPSLAAALFRTFSARREFNPIAIVVEPVTWPLRFRFYEAFRDYKHGRPEKVEQRRREFLDALDRIAW